MLHQLSGGYQGQATDIDIHARETLKIKNIVNNIYVKHTRQPLEVVHHALERDNFMGPEQAKEFGIVDQVIENRQLLVKSIKGEKQS